MVSEKRQMRTWITRIRWSVNLTQERSINSRRDCQICSSTLFQGTLNSTLLTAWPVQRRLRLCLTHHLVSKEPSLTAVSLQSSFPTQPSRWNRLARTFANQPWSTTPKTFSKLTSRCWTTLLEGPSSRLARRATRCTLWWDRKWTIARWRVWFQTPKIHLITQAEARPGSMKVTTKAAWSTEQ